MVDSKENSPAASTEYLELQSAALQRGGLFASFQRQTANEPKVRTVSTLQIVIIAASGGLGTGLLVGAADKLRVGGPLAVLIAYSVVGLLCICVLNSVGELSVAYTDLDGGFNEWYRKFLDDSVAFVLGWLYYLQWTIAISLELVTALMTIKYWNTSVDLNVFVAVFLVALCTVNFFGVRGYAEAEFVMNSIKLVMLTGFFIMGLCINLGASSSGFIGGQYWRDPGYITGFKGVVKCFLTAAFSMGGTEFVALSVSEFRNPRAALPMAIRLVFVRIIFFYTGTLAIVGLLVPYTLDRLLGLGVAYTSASPYVLAALLHGVLVVPHIINAVILVSVMLVATAAMYSLTRLLRLLAQQGYAPKWFDYTDRAGRPLRAWLVAVIASLLSFISTYEDQAAVFNWLLSIVALGLIFTWLGLCLCHLRWRAVLKHRGIPLSSLGFTAYTGVWGLYYALVVNGLILVGQFWVALFPAAEADASNFFQNYLAVPFMVLLYAGHKTYKRTWRHMYLTLDEIDLSGRTVYDDETLALDREEKAAKMQAAGWWRRPFIWFMG